MLSQNGWEANRDPKAIGVVPFAVAGVSFPNGVKGGNVETVLRYVVEQFHMTVEPLQVGCCWGYYYKTIEGSSSISNHASATAVDLNAPRHPIGSRGTFNGRQVTSIHAILTHLNGVVRWGGDYIGRADEMHFEIVGTPTEVSKVAALIRLTKEVKDMDAFLASAIRQTDGRVLAMASGTDTVRGDLLGGGSPVWIVQTLKRIEARLTAIEAEVKTLGS